MARVVFGPFSERCVLKKSEERRRGKKTIGWREWLALPELGIEQIKAKIDTGARSSTLHALDIERFERDGVAMVRFRVYPVQRSQEGMMLVEAPVLDEREVRSSNGQVQVRIVIRTMMQLGDDQWPIDLTLTNRDIMGFRMLLGREAMRGRYLIDPGRSYVVDWSGGDA